MGVVGRAARNAPHGDLWSAMMFGVVDKTRGDRLAPFVKPQGTRKREGEGSVKEKGTSWEQGSGVLSFVGAFLPCP
jgi:hypothetical protein